MFGEQSAAGGLSIRPRGYANIASNAIYKATRSARERVSNVERALVGSRREMIFGNKGTGVVAGSRAREGIGWG